MKKRILAALMLIGMGVNAQTVYYVDQDAVGFDTGTSWTDAYQSLADFISNYIPNGNHDTLMIAEGYYEESFQLGGNFSLTICGGFNGTEQYTTQADFENHPTVLYGDIAGDDNLNDVTTLDDNIEVLMVLSPAVNDNGGLGASDLKIEVLNLYFLRAANFTVNSGNGSAMLIRPNNYSPTLDPGSVEISVRNCSFQENYANGLGGAIYISSGGSNIDFDVHFDAIDMKFNESGSRGSAIMLYANQPSTQFDLAVTNSLFIGNVDNISAHKTTIYTSCLPGTFANTYVLNNTFWDNEGSATFQYTGDNNGTPINTLVFRNNIVKGTGYPSNSLGAVGDNNGSSYGYQVVNNFMENAPVYNASGVSADFSNNSSANPLLDGLLTPDATSPVINFSGSDTTDVGQFYLGKDYYGNNRFVDNIADAGAVEYQVATSGVGIDELEAKTVIYPNPTKDFFVLQTPTYANFTVYNTAGIVMQEGEAFGLNTIQASNWESGVYFIEFKMQDSIIRRPVIKL